MQWSFSFGSILADKFHDSRFGASTSQHCVLRKDDTQYLLALALADKAIHGITSAKDLWELQIPEGDDELPLRWTDDAEHRPILRDATMQHGVSEKPLSKTVFSRIMRSVLRLSGFFGDPTVHAIRRYLGKKIDGKSLAVSRIMQACMLLTS